jgi:hypothetical protein
MEAGAIIELPRGMITRAAEGLHVTQKTLSAAIKFHTKSIKADEIRRKVILEYNGDLIGCSDDEKKRIYKRLGIDVS